MDTHHSLSLAVIAWTLLAVAAPPVNAGPADVVGLRLGMTPDAIESALRERAPGSRLVTDRDSRDVPSKITLGPVRGETRIEVIEVGFTLPPDTARSVWLTRQLSYEGPRGQLDLSRALANRSAPEGAPEVSATRQALENKYGEPNSDSGWSPEAGGTLVWRLDAEKGLCAPPPPSPRARYQRTAFWAEFAHGYMNAAFGNERPCSRVIVARILARDRFVHELGVLLADPRRAAATQQASREALKREGAAQRQKRLDSAAPPPDL